MKYAPIVVFCFNRRKHLELVIESLLTNEYASDTDLIIYSDFARTIDDYEAVNSVRSYIQTISGFKSVTTVFREANYGIERNMVDALAVVGAQYGKYIVIEDDVVVSKYFLRYMNEALDFYENDHRVLTITGFCFPLNLLPIDHRYSYDVFLTSRTSSYGWGSWHKKMSRVEWSLEAINRRIIQEKARKKVKRYGEDLLYVVKHYLGMTDVPWDYRLCLNQILDNQYTVFPCWSFTNNIGFDSSGLHTPTTNIYNNDLSLCHNDWVFNLDVVENSLIVKKMSDMYKVSLKTKIIVSINNFFRMFKIRMTRI